MRQKMREEQQGRRPADALVVPKVDEWQLETRNSLKLWPGDGQQPATWPIPSYLSWLVHVPYKPS